MRLRTSALSKLTFVVAVLGALAAAHPTWAGPVAVVVPTLDAVGLAGFAGAVAVAGAWVVAHRRDRK